MDPRFPVGSALNRADTGIGRGAGGKVVGDNETQLVVLVGPGRTCEGSQKPNRRVRRRLPSRIRQSTAQQTRSFLLGIVRRRRPSESQMLFPHGSRSAAADGCVFRFMLVESCFNI